MMDNKVIRIAFLHLAPIVGDLNANMDQIRNALCLAAYNEVDWAILPELALSGYDFSPVIGTNWIQPFPNQWTNELAGIAHQNNLTCFVGMPERESISEKLYNSLAVIKSDGNLGKAYRKVHVVKVSAEKWSSPGKGAVVQNIDKIPVGFLICADAYWPDIALKSKALGAKLLLSIAAWPPGECGPNGEWETRSKETGLPLLVCNRTGYEPNMNFTQAESVVVIGGKRLYTFRADEPTIFFVDMDLSHMQFIYCGNICL